MVGGSLEHLSVGRWSVVDESVEHLSVGRWLVVGRFGGGPVGGSVVGCQ